MEDVLAVYQRPYDPNRPVVCLDEINKTLHDTPRGTLPMQPGQVARQDYQFTRNGTVNLFLKVEPLRGWRKVRVTDRRTSLDFAEEVRSLVDEDYPEASIIVLITDNLNTHTPACLYEAFPPAEARRIAAKLEWHYTPEHGSWLNVAECELSVLARQCLARRMPDKSSIISEVMAWQQKRNAAQVTIQWQFTTADARIKLRRLYPVINVQNST
jgi:DDE superfamily endonuclease